MSSSQSPAVNDGDLIGPRAAIAAAAPILTLVNVLEVPRERQSELVAILETATAEVMRRLPGFISASIHRSLDGTRVATYAQWRSIEDFERMLANPAAQAHIRDATAIATAAPFLYRVSSVHLSEA